MGDEIDPRRNITPEVYKDIVTILQGVYQGGYVNQVLSFPERKELRAKSYRILKALGVEK